MQNHVDLMGDFNDNISIHFARIRNSVKEFINLAQVMQTVRIIIQLYIKFQIRIVNKVGFDFFQMFFALNLRTREIRCQ